LNESLSAGYLLEEYKPDLITEVLNQLTPDKIRVAVVGKKFNGITDSKEKWYGTQYKMFDISPENINLWKNCQLNENLALPPINDFIPSNLNLTNREEIKANKPSMIRNTEFSRVWYLQDNEYLKPKVYYGFEFTKYESKLIYNFIFY
jgi:insulysin